MWMLILEVTTECMENPKLLRFREEHIYLFEEIENVYNGPEMVFFKGDSSLFNTVSSKSCNLNYISQSLNVPLKHRQTKGVVMIIGNISAGKSTFINWLVQDNVQKTGQAIETLKFTYITNGKKFTEMRGDSATAARPFLSDLAQKYPGFEDNLSVKLCPAYQDSLKCIDIIDTPGLADGDLHYSFPIEDVIHDMNEHVDIILVFLDPIGQALGNRLLKVAEKLYQQCPDKIRFCLSKVDEIRTEEDRIKIMCQTTQSLTARIKSRHGFDLIPIYVPGAVDNTYLLSSIEGNKENVVSNSVNRIESLVQDIVQATESRLQKNLCTLQEDISNISAVIETRLKHFQEQEKTLLEYKQKQIRHKFFRFIVLILFILILIKQLYPSETYFIYKLSFWSSAANFLRNFKTYRLYIHYLPFLNAKLHKWRFYVYLFTYIYLGILLIPKTPKETIESNTEMIETCLDIKSYLGGLVLKTENLVKCYLSEDQEEEN